jgi:hypothetical protein
MKKFAVFYISVLDYPDGIFVDGPYFGGTCSVEDQANLLSRNLTNDRQLPGTIMPKVYSYDSCAGISKSLSLAKTHCIRLAKDMYEMEETQARQARMTKARRRKTNK